MREGTEFLHGMGILIRRQMFHLMACGAIGLALTCAWAGDVPSSSLAAVRWVDKDGVIRIEGKPFFPLGMYHDSLDIDVYGERFLRDLGIIAAAGFNIAHVSMDFTHDGDNAGSSTAGRAARFAQEKGMYLAMPVYLKNIQAVVAEQAKWPAILMASLGDDFNTDARGGFAGPPKFPPERLRALAQEVKKIAPNLITYSSGSAYDKASLQGYEDTVDFDLGSEEDLTPMFDARRYPHSLERRGTRWHGTIPPGVVEIYRSGK